MRPTALLCIVLLTGCSTQPVDSFSGFVDDYFKAAFAASPSFATATGIHDYDGQIEDLSAAAVQKRIAVLEAQQSRLDTILKNQKLNAEDAMDAEILKSQILAELHETKVLETWRKNPMNYVGGPGGSIDLLMKRSFAPAKDRLKLVTSRLRGVPPMITALQANVQNPPREFTDLAIRIAGGSVGFFRDTVATWAKDAAAGDAALLAEFKTANDAAAKSFEDATKWLKEDLLPRSKGSYAIGAEAFSKKLLYEEMVDIPLDKLLAIGEANLAKDYADFVATAKLIAPNKKPAEVMTLLEADHPTEADLIPSSKRTIESIRNFIIEKKIISLPSDVLPHIEETPPYARNGGFASMDTPGAYETKATEAFYYITPPEKEWPAKQKLEHLKLFNRSVMDVITIHEAYPGHYTQFLYAKQYPTKTRKIVGVASNAEGWAHYAEQMMLEQGFGKDDPKIKLAQLHEALLRDCRYLAGIKLHTQGMSVEDATRIFEERGMQLHANAYEEARRGSYNPTYLYYTLGKLMIYKLRGDLQQAQGASFNLESFHNQYVKQGAIPIPLVRRILLPGNTASSL
ncbi:DUF885 domain-containing protein [Bryobacter aggregatus]|uniref:DUF885 domain-containing protein n=1 Tax=Bryobacter aggregatus TaxID=360054 RepID=UPI0004E11C15|nr:DUF885 domain-containing protein [Bryobacter aggregatus]